MLNTRTRDVLGQLGAINQSQIISYPVTVIKLGKSIQAFLDLSKPAPKNKDDEAKGCGESEFEEIGVYVINELNSVISVIEDPEIINNNGTLTIKNNESSISYGTTPIDIIESESRGNPEVINNVINPERNTKVMSFSLDIKALERIKKMSSLLKSLSDLRIEAKDDKITLVVTSKEKSSNNYTLDLPGEVFETSSMTIMMDYINKLPASGYEVSIYKSSRGSLVSVFKSTAVDGLNILISAKA